MTVTINGTTGIDKVQDGSIQAADLASGVPSRSQLPAGTVLQVVNATISSPVTTSSNPTFVTTGLTASITPTYSTSKILIIVSGTIDSQAANYQCSSTIYRNSTNLAPAGFTNVFSPAGRVLAPCCMNYLDSPATTSSTTYTVYFASTNAAGSVVFNQGTGIGNSPATITLMEIAA